MTFNRLKSFTEKKKKRSTHLKNANNILDFCYLLLVPQNLKERQITDFYFKVALGDYATDFLGF